MKKRVLLLTILFFLALSNQHYIDSSDKDTKVNIISAFKASNAMIMDHSINIIFNNPIKLNRAKAIFKLTEASPANMHNTLLYQKESLDITFQVNSNNMVESVRIVSPKVLELSYYEELKDQLNKDNIPSKFFFTIRGVYSKKIEDQDMEERVKKLFSHLGAQYLDGGFIKASFFSASGYTPFIEEYIPTAGSKVNVNIALKYHAKENKTVLILSTPIIYGDY